MSPQTLADQAAELNRLYPPGTPCIVWPGACEGDGVPTRTRSPWYVLGGHTVVVQVDKIAGCIAASHVACSPITPPFEPAAAALE